MQQAKLFSFFSKSPQSSQPGSVQPSPKRSPSDLPASQEASPTLKRAKTTPSPSPPPHTPSPPAVRAPVPSPPAVRTPVPSPATPSGQALAPYARSFAPRSNSTSPSTLGSRLVAARSPLATQQDPAVAAPAATPTSAIGDASLLDDELLLAVPDLSQPAPPAAASAEKSASAAAATVVDEITPDMLLQDDFDPASSGLPVKPPPASAAGKSAAAPASVPKAAKAGKDFYASKEEQRRQKEALFKKTNEQRYTWLLDENIRDSAGRKKGDPEYDPSTLHIPASAMMKLTAFEQQYWEVKRKYFDTVVFFKKGKFYELYENDADIGHRELDLQMSDRVNMRMAGVPESHFIPWASKLIKRGYKVARVDQLETSTGMAKRQAEHGTRTEKETIIRRELKQIYTVGTLVDEALIRDPRANYLLCLKEDERSRRFGVCFVDTSTGEFNLGSVADDRSRSRLETLLLQIRPAEIVYEKAGLSQGTLGSIKRLLTSVSMTSRNANDCWDAQRVAAEISSRRYFGTAADRSEVAKPEGVINGHGHGNGHAKASSATVPPAGEEVAAAAKQSDWPAALQQAAGDNTAMAAFGMCLGYLASLQLDQQLASLGNFRRYDLAHQTDVMVLDGQTLANLEVLENARDGGPDGTLLRLLDHCATPFGHRLLRRWLCRPLCVVSEIDDRLDAVEDLNADPELRSSLLERLASLPDLERQLSRIHAGSLRVADFLGVLDGFSKCQELVSTSNVGGFKSKRLRRLLTVGDLFPAALAGLLDDFRQRFDQKLARDEGAIEPRPGFEPDFDKCRDQIAAYEQQLQEHLETQRAVFGTKQVKFVHQGKSQYMLEVPASCSGKAKPASNYELVSQTKGVERYHTPQIKTLVAKLLDEQDTLAALKRQLLQRLLAKFDESYRVWMAAVQCVAEVDALLSLAKASAFASGGSMTRPVFIESERPYLELVESRHPCINLWDSQFIPNDVRLGGDEPAVMLLTGPNMGGKSTLLRQTCIAVIMAQVGCFVAAEKFALTPVDRIFTRIGANDNILAGQSTFMVELHETSLVLEHATPASLVILDELGRGTSTYDGYAIAYGVLDHIATKLGCRTLFSTHYHRLCAEPVVVGSTGLVSLHHMDAIVDEEKNDVTFLYKLAPGVCPKSYGMNVAKMAGLSAEIVAEAERVARLFEEQSQGRMNADANSPRGEAQQLLRLMRTTIEHSSQQDASRLHEALLSVLRGSSV